MSKKPREHSVLDDDVGALEIGALDELRLDGLGTEIGLPPSQLQRWRRGRSDRPPAFSDARVRPIPERLRRPT